MSQLFNNHIKKNTKKKPPLCASLRSLWHPSLEEGSNIAFLQSQKRKWVARWGSSHPSIILSVPDEGTSTSGEGQPEAPAKQKPNDVERRSKARGRGKGTGDPTARPGEWGGCPWISLRHVTSSAPQGKQALRPPHEGWSCESRNVESLLTLVTRGGWVGTAARGKENLTCPLVSLFSSVWLRTPVSFSFSLVSLIRGQVVTTDGTPLVGVNVSFVKYPKYGYTITRQDGT